MLLLTLVASPVPHSLSENASLPRCRRWTRAGRITAAVSLLALLPGPVVSQAQTTAVQPAVAQSAPGDQVVRISRDDAITLALENNPDLAVSRFDPAISATQVLAARGAFMPTVETAVQANSQLQPPTNLFSGDTGLQTNLWSSSISFKIGRAHV